VNPVKNIGRAKTKYELKTPKLAEYIKAPKRKERTIIEGLINSIPFIILTYGNSKLKLLSKVVKQPVLSMILRLTASSISWAAKRFSVEQK